MTHRTIHTACRAARNRPPAQRSGKRSWGGWIAGAALAAFVAVLHRRIAASALDPRVANPNVQGRPRPVEVHLRLGLHRPSWTGATVVALIVLLIVFIRGWRRNPGSPVMLMFLCTTLIVWQDPIMNWSPFAVYNPDLVALAGVLAAGVAVADRRTVRRVRLRDVLLRAVLPGGLDPAQAAGKRAREAFVSRHPLVSLGLLMLVIGFVFDAMPGDQPGPHRACTSTRR